MRRNESKLASCGLRAHDEREAISAPEAHQVHPRALVRLPSSLCKPSLRTHFDWDDNGNDDYAKRPLLLDLFSGAGGAAFGYYLAGFRVVGVDIRPQPRYPFEFHQADALTFPLEGFDAIHASPVCKGWTRAKHIHGHKDWYPMDQVAETRDRLQSSGLPYVLENVIGAPLMNPILLCGLMFGLRVLRHRHFESNLLFPRLDHPRHVGTTNSHRGMGKGGELVCVAGHNFLMAEAKEAMGIDWMVQAEISQSIPPAYAEWIGRRILEAV